MKMMRMMVTGKMKMKETSTQAAVPARIEITMTTKKIMIMVPIAVALRDLALVAQQETVVMEDIVHSKAVRIETDSLIEEAAEVDNAPIYVVMID